MRPAPIHRLVSRTTAYAAAVALAMGAAPVARAQSVTITDLKDRKVTLARPARRLLIDDGRYLVALSLLHKDPVAILSAWPRDVNRIGERTFQKYRAAFPRIDSVAQIPSSAGSFSLEKVIAVRPDVAVFTLGLGPSDEQVKQMEAAGIKVLFIDFFSHPLEHLDRSLTVLGQATGRSAEAARFLEFRRAHMQVIARTLAAKRVAAPRVFVEAHAGLNDDCCNSPGKGNVGDYIDFVGGHNIGADALSTTYGKLNLEFVIGQNPFVYIATGGPHLEKAGGLVLGSGYTAERARASLARVAARPGIASLSAVRAARVHGIAHQLLNSPLDILAVESFARWIHPELFATLDPGATLAEINTRFLAVPLDGPQWIDLR